MATEQVGALAEVVENQRRHDEPVPRECDGPSTEVTHIGIERFASSDSKNDGRKDEERMPATMKQKAHRVVGAESGKNSRCARNLSRTQRADR